MAGARMSSLSWGSGKAGRVQNGPSDSTLAIRVIVVHALRSSKCRASQMVRKFGKED